MATVNKKMTALADEIRELSGTTTSKSVDAMTSDVDAANIEIARQAELLAQVIEALESKMGDNEYGEVPANVSDFYTYTSSGTGYKLGLSADFKTAINGNTDYIKGGKTLWKAGTALPNPGSIYSGEPVTKMTSMFRDVTLTSLDLSEWDTSNVTDMTYMFANCSSLTSLDLSEWDTSNVTNMTYMFAYCSSLTSLDLSNFTTSKVTSMYRMFINCSALTSLDVSGFDTSQVKDTMDMFTNCSALTTLDLRSFDTSKVTYIQYNPMFSGCSSLTKILARSEADAANYKASHNFPNGCTVLHVGQGGNGGAID